MSDENTYNSEDAKEIDRRKKAEKNAVNLQVDDLKYLMTLPQFRRFMWHNLMFCQIFQVADPHSEQRPAGFFDGQRNVGLMHFGHIQEACPELYLEMTKEANEKGNAYND